jgi:hypothetical protein
MIKKDIVAQVQKNVCRPLLVLSSVWRGAPSPTFDQTTQISENGTPCLSAAMGDFITCGAATPKLLSAASSSHRGRRPSVSVLLESTLGASIAYHSTPPTSFRRFYACAKHQQIWLIASPVAQPPPIRLTPLHLNTMGDIANVRFCQNHWWGRVIGGVLPMELNSVIFTHDNQLGYGAATPNPLSAASFQHCG